MNNPRRSTTPLTLSQVLTVLFWIVSAFGLVGLVQSGSTTLEKRQQAEALRQQLNIVEDEQKRLQIIRDRVTSPEYIEEVARHDMKMSRPGEIAVVPAATPAPPR